MDKNEPLNLLDFKQIIEKTSEIIQVIDGQGNFLYTNKAWKDILGYEEEDVHRLEFNDIITSPIEGEKEVFIRQVITGKRFKDVELIFLSKTGTQIAVKGNIFSLFDDEKQALKVIGLFKDVSLLRDETLKEEKLLKIIQAESKFKIGDQEEIDYQGIANLMLCLSDARYVSFNLYDAALQGIITVGIAGENEYITQAEKTLGFEIRHKKWIYNEQKENLFKDKSVVIFQTLQELTSNIIDEHLVKYIELQSGVGEIVQVNIAKEGKSLGDFTLMMDKDRKFNAHDIVELFASQIGLVIAKNQAEKKLKQSKEKFLHTIEATGAATWEWNLTTNEVNYSAKWSEMLGYDLGEIEATPTQWEKLWHPDDKKRIKQNIQDYLSGKIEQYEIIHRLRTKSHDYKWIMSRGSVLKDEELDTVYFVGIHIDVTHLHKEEEKRISENKKLLDILEATNAGTWEWNILTGEMTYNERWAKIIGYTLEEISPLTKETFKRYAHSEDFKESDKEIKSIFNKEKEYYSLECRMKHKDGRTIWVLDKGKVISWTEEGKPAVMFGTHIDITESKNLEMEIKESEDKYRILVESSYDIIYHIDMKGNFTYVSRAWTEQLGHSLDVIGKPFKPYVHPEDIQMIWGFFTGVEKSKERMQTTDYRLLHKDGTWHWFNTNATALWNEYGENVGFAGTARDVTDMKKASKKLREQKDELEQFFTVNLDFFCIINPKGYFLKVNLPWEKDLGYDLDYLLSRPVLDFIHEDDYFIVQNAFDSILQRNEVNITCRFRRIDGTYRILEWKAQYNEGIIYAAARDVTNNKHLEESLHLEKELFRTTLLSVGDGVISTDHQGRITIMNEAAQSMTGWCLKEAMGKQLHDIYVLYHEKTRASLKNHVHEVINKGEMKKHEDIILIGKDQNEVPIEDRSSPIKNSLGNITGAVIVFRDITDKKEKQKRNEFMIYHDALTGLYNRRYMDDALKKVERSRHLPLTIMVVDVNGLKLTNDAFGHDNGDELLKKVAEILIEVSRENDVVARVGGDEFVILLPRTNIAQAEEIKKQIVKMAKAKEHHPIMISLGIGYAAKTYNTQNLKEVQKVADNNMYRDKLKYGKIMKGKMVGEILKNINEEFPTEKRHLENVETYCRELAIALEFSKAEITRVTNAGRLHDIGKISVPKEILEKPGKLTLEEYEIIKRHSEVSYQILKSVDQFAVIAEDVLYHHERIDGTGYPEGISGDDIPMNSKIIAVVDSYDAMVGNRSYQKRKTKDEAIEELRRFSGTQFDSHIVDVFIEKVLLKSENKEKI